MKYDHVYTIQEELEYGIQCDIHPVRGKVNFVSPITAKTNKDKSLA